MHLGQLADAWRAVNDALALDERGRYYHTRALIHAEYGRDQEAARDRKRSRDLGED